MHVFDRQKRDIFVCVLFFFHSDYPILGYPIYIYKRPGRASQNSSLIISQCINSILDRTDLDLFLFFFFTFGFVGLLLCVVFSSDCDGVLSSSLWIVNSSVMGIGAGRSAVPD